MYDDRAASLVAWFGNSIGTLQFYIPDTLYLEIV